MGPYLGQGLELDFGLGLNLGGGRGLGLVLVLVVLVLVVVVVSGIAVVGQGFLLGLSDIALPGKVASGMSGSWLPLGRPQFGVLGI